MGPPGTSLSVAESAHDGQGGGRGFVYPSVLYRCRGSHRGDSSTPEPRRPSLSGVPAEFPKIKKTPFCASDKSSIVLKFPTAVQLCIMLS